jgi:hypothetical protein
MRQILSIIFLLALCSPLFAADEYRRATLTITNSTTTNDAFTVNGSTRRGAGTRTATTFVTNSSPMTVTTNIFSQIGGWSPSGLIVITNSGSNVIVLEGINLAASASNFMAITWETNAISVRPWALMLPPSAFAASVNASNASAVATLLDSSTNRIGSNVTAMAHFASLQGAQTLANKTLTAPTINGGYGTNQAIDKASLSNANFYGTAVGFTVPLLLSSAAPLKVENGTIVTNTDTGAFWTWGEGYYRPAFYGELTNVNALINADLALSTGVGDHFVRSNTPTIYSATLLGTNAVGAVTATAHTYTGLVNGDNSNVELGTNLVTTLSGATGTPNLHSFALKEVGRIVFVEVTGATNVVIYNESGTESTDATRRITTGTGGNITMTNSPATFILRRTPTRWQLWDHSR